MKTVTKITLILSLVFSCLGAVPRFSLESGASCSLCHVNPTGGGLRNDYGTTIFALDELPMQGLGLFNGPDWSGQITDHIRFGGDFRLQSILHRDSEEEINVPLHAMQADVYMNISLNESLSFYYRQGLGTNGGNEYWMLLTDLPYNGWLKAGKALPDFGLRLDDHSAYIRGGNLRSIAGLPREGLFFAPPPYGSIPVLLEGGLKLTDGLRMSASIANAYTGGGDASYGFGEQLSDKAITGKLSWFRDIGRISLNLNASALVEGDVSAAGFSGGVSLGPLSWMFEVDQVENLTDDAVTLAVFHEAAYRITEGLYALLKHDYFDPHTDLKNGALNRYAAGLEFYPGSAIGVVVQLRSTQIETSDMDQPDPEILLQLHSWF